MLVLALANGKGIKREIIGPSPQEMHKLPSFGDTRLENTSWKQHAFWLKELKKTNKDM